MPKVKISQFLSWLDYASLYDSAALGNQFREQTGEEPCWHDKTASVADYENVILDKDGGRSPTPEERFSLPAVVSGVEVATALAAKHGTPYESAMGRGTTFRRCLEALINAGL